MAPLWLFSCFALVGAAFGECQDAFGASQVALVVEKLPPDAGNIRDADLIPGSGRCPGGGHGHPLWYSSLENPTDRGAWWAAVHGVTKSWTQLK